jgi:hypothetical protein
MKKSEKWTKRLKKEIRKLNIKINALEQFIEGEHGTFDELLESDQDLLKTQHATMVAYSNILAIRMKKAGLCKKKRRLDIEDMLEDIFNPEPEANKNEKLQK